MVQCDVFAPPETHPELQPVEPIEPGARACDSCRPFSDLTVVDQWSRPGDNAKLLPDDLEHLDTRICSEGRSGREHSAIESVKEVQHRLTHAEDLCKPDVRK